MRLMADDEPVLELQTPWRRDLGEVGGELDRWAKANVAPDAAVRDAASPGNGMSSETVLFTMTAAGESERYAARLAPTPDVYPVFPEYDIELQAKCMRLVRARTDVPAPDVRFLELDAQWLGTPFLVMKRIDGDAPPDIPPYVFMGWVADATPDQRAAMQRRTLEVLAKLHELTPSNADLSFLARPEHGATPLQQQLGYQRYYYDWAREGLAYPLIERTFDWLDAHLPAEGDPVLNWGDSRVGNTLYRDFTPVAVLDWEMATVGPREVDHAWMLLLHRFFDDMAVRFGMQGMKDFLQRVPVIAEYEELSGHRVRDLEWFEVFAALRFAIVSVRTSTRGIAYGQMEPPADPDDLIMFRNLLEQMLEGTYWSR
jgi:aminoglycoside phosphotransferase (APT) family kinase protein